MQDTGRRAGSTMARAAATAAALSLAALCGAAAGPQPAAAQEPFRIGLVALPGEDTGVEGLERIRSAYSRALGEPVEVLVARDYAALARAQIEGRVDYAVYSASAYAAARLRCGCLVPIAAPVDAGGAIGIRSVLVVGGGRAAGSGRLAVGPQDSLAARLIPLSASQEARAAAAEGRLVETDSAAQAQALFVEGRVDGFFGWVPATGAGESEQPEAGAGGTPAQLAAAGLDPSAWRIVWRSPVLRYGPHAVHADMPAARRQRLAGFLAGAADLGTRLGTSDGGRLVAVTAADYAAVERALGALDP